jgi:peptidoglycan/xylan/chitin deacetylase (PgdA/CDA1 family)
MGDSKRRPLAGRRSVLLGMAGLATAVLAGCAEAGSGNVPPAPEQDVAAEHRRPSGPATPPPSIAAKSSEQAAAARAQPTPRPLVLPGKGTVVAEFAGRKPQEWGLHVTGVVNDAPSKQAALTFDACGGPGGSDCDHELLRTLRRLNVPATLFVNSRWIRANQALAAELAADPLFELANHGTSHLPLSVNGRSAYGIVGTANVSAAYDELAGNQQSMFDTFGKTPRFFRPGTAFYDDVTAAMTRRVGMLPVNFTINGDGGATFPAATVAAEVGRVGPGDIVISHFNKPAGATAEGYARILPRLLDKGISFGRLGDIL